MSINIKVRVLDYDTIREVLLYRAAFLSEKVTNSTDTEREFWRSRYKRCAAVIAGLRASKAFLDLNSRTSVSLDCGDYYYILDVLHSRAEQCAKKMNASSVVGIKDRYWTQYQRLTTIIARISRCASWQNLATCECWRCLAINSGGFNADSNE